MLIKVKVDGTTNLYESTGGLWVPGHSVAKGGDNVIAALYYPTGEKQIVLGRNLVVTTGCQHYAQKINGDTPTNAFGVHELLTVAPTPAASDNRSNYTVQASSAKAVSSTYPKLNDTDADNSGKGTYVFTHKFEYTTGDGNWTGLNGGIITNASPGASEPILTGYSFGGAINKDSSTALTIWINHTLVGA